jgi:hypothetical protein
MRFTATVGPPAVPQSRMTFAIPSDKNVAVKIEVQENC